MSGQAGGGRGQGKIKEAFFEAWTGLGQGLTGPRKDGEAVKRCHTDLRALWNNLSLPFLMPFRMRPKMSASGRNLSGGLLPPVSGFVKENSQLHFRSKSTLKVQEHMVTTVSVFPLHV